MTDPLPDPAAATAPAPTTAPAAPAPVDGAEDAGWQSLPADAATLAGLTGALIGLLPGIGAGIGIGVLARNGLLFGLGMVVLFAVLCAGVTAWTNRARTLRTRWRLDPRGLQVRRGLVWHSDLLVPRNRVQHLDIERGPLERQNGLATLVVHTAGTRLYALRQPGFADADAVALRDALLPERERDDDVL